MPDTSDRDTATADQPQQRLEAAGRKVAAGAEGAPAPSLRVRQTAWTARPLHDGILATGPVAAGRREDLALVRQRALRERRKTLPVAFANPVARSGLAVLLPGTGDARGLVWRDADGTGLSAVASSIAGDRAELAWTAGAPPRARDYRLENGKGELVARVEFDRLGGLAFTAIAPGASAWLWLEVTVAPVRTGGEPLSWRRLQDEPWPATWTRDEPTSNGVVRRVDLRPGPALPAQLTVALCADGADWALVTELEMVRRGPEP